MWLPLKIAAAVSQVSCSCTLVVTLLTSGNSDENCSPSSDQARFGSSLSFIKRQPSSTDHGRPFLKEVYCGATSSVFKLLWPQSYVISTSGLEMDLDAEEASTLKGAVIQ